MWLVISAHIWFLAAVVDPRTDLVIRLVPTIALVCLVAGFALGWRYPHRALWWAAASASLSIGYLVLADALRGAIPDGLLSDWGATVLFYTFGALQLAFLALLVWRSSGSRRAAALFAGFCVPYALWSSFCAGMSLADTWL